MGLRSAPKRISWQDRISTGRGPYALPSDECVIRPGLLILPDRLRDRLEPDEWRPLVASSLVYRRKLVSKMFRHVMKRWVLGLILPVSLLATFLVLVYWPGKIIGIPGIIVGIFISVGIPAIFISAPYVKRVRLQADRIAADIVGRTAFLQVLKRIDEMGLDDIVSLERRKGLRARFTGRPTITERIENLASDKPTET